MAVLKEGIKLDAKSIDVDLFYSENGNFLLEAFTVENNKYALVKEVLPEGMGYTFFEIETQKRIGISSRYNSENGKLTKSEIDEKHQSICTVVVDPKTGFEKLLEKIVNEDGDIVYSNTIERYSNGHVDSLINRYAAYKKQEEENKTKVQNIIRSFTSSELSEKVNILRGIFRKEWRNKCELGFENPELFLSKDLYRQLSSDKQFKVALFEMLKREEKTVDILANDLYKKILEYYEN